MKRFVITEYGTEEVERSRRFVIEVPDGCDPKNLDPDLLHQRADEAGVCFEEAEDSSGIDGRAHEH